ncbi:MAG: integrin alpha, partial [Phycisphaerales bacterium]
VIYDDIDDTPLIGGVQTHGWVDIDGNGVWTPGKDFRGYVGDGQLSGKGFHKDLGAVYLVYGTAGGFHGHLELREVGDPSDPHSGATIRGHSLWGMTGRGADLLSPDDFDDNDTPNDPSDDTYTLRKFDSPEFGYSLAGNKDLDGDGVPDYIIGVPKMAKPRLYQPFPLSTGGMVAVFKGKCLSQARAINTPGDFPRYMELYLLGEMPDVNGDGVGNITDLEEILTQNQ